MSCHDTDLFFDSHGGLWAVCEGCKDAVAFGPTGRACPPPFMYPPTYQEAMREGRVLRPSSTEEDTGLRLYAQWGEGLPQELVIPEGWEVAPRDLETAKEELAEMEKELAELADWDRENPEWDYEASRIAARRDSLKAEYPELF